MLCLLLPHQGSALDLLGGLQHSAEPLLISSCLRNVKWLSTFYKLFGTPKWWYDKVLGKTPAESFIFPIFSCWKLFLVKISYIVIATHWLAKFNLRLKPLISKILLLPWHILLTVLVSQKLVQRFLLSHFQLQYL